MLPKIGKVKAVIQCTAIYIKFPLTLKRGSIVEIEFPSFSIILFRISF